MIEIAAYSGQAKLGAGRFRLRECNDSATRLYQSLLHQSKFGL